MPTADLILTRSVSCKAAVIKSSPMKQISTLLLLLLLLPALGFGQDAEQAYRAGLSFAQAGRYQEAIGRYRDAVRLDSTHWQAYQALGDAYLKVGMNSDALDAYTRSLRINPANTQLDQSIQPLRQAEVLRSIRTNLPGDPTQGSDRYHYRHWFRHGIIAGAAGFGGFNGKTAVGLGSGYSWAGRYFFAYGWKSWLAFQGEIGLAAIYTQLKYTTSEGVHVHFSTSQYTLQVPVLAKHYFTKSGALLLGPCFNFPMGQTELAPDDTPINSPLLSKAMVFSGVFGLQTDISSNTFLDLRLNAELSSEIPNADFRNWNIVAGFGYDFL